LQKEVVLMNFIKV